MSFKQFIKPTVGKIIVFLLLVFIIVGVPATKHEGGAFCYVGQPCPSTSPSFGFYSPVVMYYQVYVLQYADYSVYYSLNYFALIGWLIAAYLLACIPFYLIQRKHEN